MRAVVVAVALLALASCTSDDAEPDAKPTPTPTATPSATPAPAPPPAPAVGACYRLSYTEAVAPTNEDTPVACAKGHTTQTFAVGRLDLVTNGHLLAVDSEEVRAQVARRCPTKLAAYVGGTEAQLRLSLLRPVWFTPTIEQADAGAAWYRCDVIAVSGDKRIAKVEGDLAGVLEKAAGREAYGMCGTSTPGEAAFARVLCREDHSWKAISVVDLSGKAAKKGRYPGEGVVKDAGQGPCADAAREIASDALDYQWGYEWPTRDQWQAGQTYGRCWSPDPA
ncbi:septum formation family protein [Nocardioides halotolerans]|uniref:septum formation family protein n=1 Tax=Nocardioides halotolerans TaxID=433660 RepID=UPI000684C31A